MIIETILNALQSLILRLFSFLNLPDMPEAISSAFSKLLEFLSYGNGMFGFFLPGSVVQPFFAVFVIIFAIDHGYPFVMWILRKIPMLGIS